MSTDLDVDKGPAVLTTVWALSSAACMFVAARLLVRVRILQKAGWDDWLITLSMVWSTSTNPSLYTDVVYQWIQGY